MLLLNHITESLSTCYYWLNFIRIWGTNKQIFYLYTTPRHIAHHIEWHHTTSHHITHLHTTPSHHTVKNNKSIIYIQYLVHLTPLLPQHSWLDISINTLENILKNRALMSRHRALFSERRGSDSSVIQNISTVLENVRSCTLGGVKYINELSLGGERPWTHIPWNCFLGGL
jgi:hypothetical protein